LGVIEERCARLADGVSDIQTALARQLARLEGVGGACDGVQASVERLVGAVASIGESMQQLLLRREEGRKAAPPPWRGAYDCVDAACQTANIWGSGGSPPAALPRTVVATPPSASGRGAGMAPAARLPRAVGGAGAPVGNTLTMTLRTRSPSPAPSRTPSGSQRQQVSGGGSGGKGVQPAPPAAGEGSGGGGHPVSAKKRPGGRGARLLQQAASMPGQRLLCFLPAAAPAAAAAAAATTPLPRGPRDAPTGMNSDIREVLRTIQQMPQTQSAGAPSRKRGSPDASAFITASAAAAHLSPCGGAAALHFSSDRRASFSGGKGAGCGRGGDGSDDKYRVIGGARGCCSGDEEDEEEEEEDEETIERRLAARIASHRSKRLRRLMGAVPAASQPRWLV
jgi:hypothetical protein